MTDLDNTEQKPRYNRPELAIVGVLVALGLYATVAGFEFGVGTVARMGPGFFPALLGIAVIGLAAALFVEQRYAPKTALAMPWGPLFFIFAGLCFWAGTVRALGLAPATFGLVLIASLADRPFRPFTALTMALVLSIGGVALFIYGFRLPMTAFNW